MKPFTIKNNFITNSLLLLACSSFLLLPAFINGYPIVNPDTGTYLFSGFLFEIPAGRPITYGLLIRLFSFNGATLWPVVIAQALIVSTLITFLIRQYVTEKQYFIISIVTIAILATTTSLSWIVSELIADVYTAIGLLSVLCLFICKTNKHTRIVLYALLFIAICTHISHTMIFLIVAGLLLLLNRFLFAHASQKAAIRKSMTIAGICIVSMALLLPTTSKSKHAFLAASFLEKGILKQYLNDKCPTIQYTICKYKDSMWDDLNWFLWRPESPLAKEGGWAATKEEYSKINTAILTHSPYNIRFLKQSIIYTAKQLHTFHIGDGNGGFDSSSGIAHAIRWHVSIKESERFVNAAQNNNAYSFEKLNTFNKILTIVIAISAIILLSALGILNRAIDYPHRQLIFITLSGIIINGWNCATFSTVVGRYGCRVMWLLPFCAILLLLQLTTTLRRRSAQGFQV